MTVTLAVGTGWGHDKCHSPAQVKRNLNSRRKREVREQAWSLFDHCGIVDLAAGTGTCVACGKPGLYLDAPDNDLALELGHDVSDAHNGAFCAFCNLVPLHRSCNKALGDLNLSDSLNVMSDWRYGIKSWGGVISEHVMRESWGPFDWSTRTSEARQIQSDNE